MSTTRRRISIHDYPEHLNPFSENHLTFQDRRKMLADKLRKNGTWSSKISKRLSRSVSWLEKSWLTAEESHKKSNSNGRICDKVHESGYQHCEQTNGLSRTDSYLDISHRRENNSPNRTHLAITAKSDDDEPSAPQSCSKPEPKRRKKRPAPLPPIADTKVNLNEKDEAEAENKQPETDHKLELHNTSTETRTGDPNANANPADNSNDQVVTKTSPSNSIVEPAESDHEVDDDGGGSGGGHVPSTSEISDPPVPQSRCSRLQSEESSSEEQAAVGAQKQPLDEQTTESGTEGATTTVDHNQNQIEDPKSQPPEESTQSSPPTEADSDQTLDENDNVSCVQSPPRTTDTLSMHCNGKAVMV